MDCEEACDGQGPSRCDQARSAGGRQLLVRLRGKWYGGEG